MKEFLSAKLTELESMGLFGVYLLDKKYNKSHSTALKLGYKIDKEHDVYVLDGYGAFVENIFDENIKSLNNLKTSKYYELIRQGYELVFGPMFPNSDGDVIESYKGLYCKNYLEMIKQNNSEENMSLL